MHPSLNPALPLAAAGAAIAAASHLPAGTDRYRAVLLEALDNGSINLALDINESGIVSGVSGSSMTNPGQHAVIWTGEALTNLDPMFDLSEASVINDAGMTAGVGHFCPPMNGPCTGVIARALPGGEFVAIGSLGGPNGQVLDISSTGEFVGWWSNDQFSARAFRFTEQDGLLELGTLGGFASAALATNDAGQVVGWSYTSALQQHAFLWQDGTMSDLGTLGGAQSQAADISSDGTIVGWAMTADGQAHAFRSIKGGELQDIQSLPNAISSSALVIGDNGAIAGLWHDGVSERPFLYTDADGMIDLGLPDVDNLLAFFGEMHMTSDGIVAGAAVNNLYQAFAWIWSRESGMRLLQDLVVNDAKIQILGIGGMNESGVIAVNGQHPETFNPQVAAVLIPVAAEDLNADGLIGAADLAELLASWGKCPPPDAGSCLADLTGDSVVGPADLAQLLSSWN
jgi:probable HAF family extracellular repeat protein